jgi:hopene-associated glycosyltransferase HpnB
VLVLAAVSLAIWGYLVAGHGRFWWTSIRLPPAAEPDEWPSVVAVVPARNESAALPHALPTLVGQRYGGPFRVVVVDDASTDGTGALAARLGADVVTGTGPPPGWAGKVAAMSLGLDKAGEADYVLFTDADIAYPADAVAGLVRAALGQQLDLVSQMVRLRTRTRWEKLIVPAFVYFFAQLYPFARVNSPRRRTAAAAGGCMLVHRAALESAGGLERIRGALIDDVALGTLLKRRAGRGRIWLGLSDRITSERPYPGLAALWQMVARSAYTQLRHSPALLAGTVLGLLLVYVAPVVVTVSGAITGAVPVVVLGALAWALMTLSYLPMLRHYRLGGWRAVGLPLVAVLYLAMTVDSARLHARGRGGAWKGRTV